MGALDFLVVSAGKPSMSIKLLVFFGGGSLVLGERGCQFYPYGRRSFQGFERRDQSFDPGCLRNDPGCPQDIRPENVLFGLMFRS